MQQIIQEKHLTNQSKLEPLDIPNAASTLDHSTPDELKNQLAELSRLKQQLENNAGRMERYLKEKLRKERTSRLFHWGAEMEHQLYTYAPAQKTAIGQITQDMQKDFMQQLFDDDDIRLKILQLLSDIL